MTPARRLVHAMLDGVFECRNHFFDVPAGNSPRRSTFGHSVIGGDRTKALFNVMASRSSWRHGRRPQ
jgi:hypothetical protein